MSARNAVAFEALDHEELRKPGAYRFFERDGKRVGITHGCPCGCGLIGSLYFAGNGLTPQWTVTGEWPKATLAPSIGFWGRNTKEQGYHWHGFLRAGVFEEC